MGASLAFQLVTHLRVVAGLRSVVMDDLDGFFDTQPKEVHVAIQPFVGPFAPTSDPCAIRQAREHRISAVVRVVGVRTWDDWKVNAHRPAHCSPRKFAWTRTRRAVARPVV